jgi:hypothetical protein
MLLGRACIGSVSQLPDFAGYAAEQRDPYTNPLSVARPHVPMVVVLGQR